MRTFEIPGVGGIMLAEKSAEQGAFYRADEEIFLFDSMDELYRQCRTICALGTDEVMSIREKAIQRTKKERYYYEQRAIEAIRAISEELAIK